MIMDVYICFQNGLVKSLFSLFLEKDVLNDYYFLSSVCVKKYNSFQR
jgi:hypothetical protein